MIQLSYICYSASTLKSNPWTGDPDSNYNQYSTGECESHSVSCKPEDHVYKVYITLSELLTTSY